MAGEGDENGRLLDRIDERVKATNEKLDEIARVLPQIATRLRQVETYQGICDNRWQTHQHEHVQHDKSHEELTKKFRNLDIGGFAASIVAAVIGFIYGGRP